MKKKTENKDEAPKEKTRKLKVNKQTLKDLDTVEKVQGGMLPRTYANNCRPTDTCNCY